MKYKFHSQLDSSDCGPACLRMICDYYGRRFSSQFINQISYLSKTGISLLNISDAAESIGFKTLKLGLSIDQLIENGPLPAILFWRNKHFIVLFDIKNRTNKKKAKFIVADPSIGLITLDNKTFKSGWLTSHLDLKMGYALFFEPTEKFYQNQSDKRPKKKNLLTLSSYLFKHKSFFLQLFFGLLGSSLLSLLLPFLTQSLVDFGIRWNDISFVTLILIVQIFIFIGNISIEYIRSHLILHYGTRINISIISDFLMKLTRLPLSYFDSKLTGDLLTRVQDHKRIESFLTSSVLSTLFSIVNIIVLLLVILIYDKIIFLIVILGLAGSITWTTAFLKKRRDIDYRIFATMAEDKDNLYEILSGMEEIKLNAMEKYKRWGWEKTQMKLFKSNQEFLQLDQYQSIGSAFFSQLRNILVTYFTAIAVINGSLTLGMLVSISFIVGQLDGPLNKLVTFFKIGQNAIISLERLAEVYDQEDEELGKPNVTEQVSGILNSSHGNGINGFEYGAIEVRNLNFHYNGVKSPCVLENINFDIPLGKTTAIVGSSGSGKSTLVKLLLKFYVPTSGAIYINGFNLNDVSPIWWRKQCGVVMQDGYIFNDSIEMNIVGGSESISNSVLDESIRISNITDLVSALPQGKEFKIGKTGNELSKGQKQRILIARSIYKQPPILIFDEATNSLDATNERTIVENLKNISINKTMIVIAHRLSTVKNADQIVVLNEGKVVEIGQHTQLVGEKGRYFNLVKDQLELGE